MLHAIIGACLAFKKGAPAGACASLQPKHNGTKQLEQQPAALYETHNGDFTITLTLHGSPFKGFIIKVTRYS